jgi:hypothetical protein
MDRHLVLITGCQRSGTTLLHLVLDSHPAIRSVDETDYWESGRTIDDYLADPTLPLTVAFKLPQEAAHVEQLLATHSRATVLWCIRDPRDVVASMISLPLKYGTPPTLVWACHPNGAPHELATAIPALSDDERARLAAHLERYERVREIPPAARTREHALFSGALCWRVKNELLVRYEQSSLPLYQVRYEELVTAPRQMIGALLNALQLPWHEDVLHHHQLHSGMLIGRTDAARAIDETKLGRFKEELSPDDLALIREVTGELAARLGYSF